MQQRGDLPVWRSLLYVPVNVPRFVAKAHTRGADAVQLDIEDSVPAGEKAAARKLVQEAAETVSQAGADVRITLPPPLTLSGISAPKAHDMPGPSIAKKSVGDSSIIDFETTSEVPSATTSGNEYLCLFVIQSSCSWPKTM